MAHLRDQRLQFRARIPMGFGSVRLMPAVPIVTGRSFCGRFDIPSDQRQGTTREHPSLVSAVARLFLQVQHIQLWYSQVQAGSTLIGYILCNDSPKFNITRFKAVSLFFDNLPWLLVRVFEDSTCLLLFRLGDLLWAEVERIIRGSWPEEWVLFVTWTFILVLRLWTPTMWNLVTLSTIAFVIYQWTSWANFSPTQAPPFPTCLPCWWNHWSLKYFYQASPTPNVHQHQDGQDSPWLYFLFGLAPRLLGNLEVQQLVVIAKICPTAQKTFRGSTKRVVGEDSQRGKLILVR